MERNLNTEASPLEIDDAANFPVKKRRLASENLKKVLFDDSLYSDITIECLGRTWKLHKEIIKSCPFFSSLLDDKWRDNREDVHNLEIPDPTVTEEGLHACFESMYSDVIELNRTNVLPILAGASYFELKDLMQKCYGFLVETMDVDNTLEYYGYTITYGDGQLVQNATMEYLKLFLIRSPGRNIFCQQIPDISVELMAKLIASPDLYSHDETMVFMLLVHWLYAKVTGIKDPKLLQNDYSGAKYFLLRAKSSPFVRPFLRTAEGKPYMEVMGKLRAINMIPKDRLLNDANTRAKFAFIENTKIFPQDWFKDSLTELARTISPFRDLAGALCVSKDFFDAHCYRKGVSRAKMEEFSTTINCYRMGIDLICRKSGSEWILKLKRTPTTAMTHWVSLKRRDVFAAIKVVAVKNSKRILFSKQSGIQMASLMIGEEFQIMEIGEEFNHQDVYFVVNFLF